jgi:hypothetical protein
MGGKGRRLCLQQRRSADGCKKQCWRI